MKRVYRPLFSLRVLGDWADVLEPTAEELQAFQLFPRELAARRRAEIGAYIDQVRLAMNDNDRRFLRSLRVVDPQHFRS